MPPLRIYHKVVLPVLIAFLAAMAIVYFTLKPDRFSGSEPQLIYADGQLDLEALRSSGHELYRPLFAYQKSSYSEAIRQLSAIDLPGKPYRDTGEFFLGAAYLYSGRPVEAISHFDSLLAMGRSAYAPVGVELRAEAKSMTEKRAVDRIRNRVPLRRNWITRWLLVFATLFVLAGAFNRWRFGR